MARKEIKFCDVCGAEQKDAPDRHTRQVSYNKIEIILKGHGYPNFVFNDCCQPCAVALYAVVEKTIKKLKGETNV